MKVIRLGFNSRFTPFKANVPILFFLKTPENHCFSDWFSGIFMGYEMEILEGNAARKVSLFGVILVRIFPHSD